MKFCSLTVLLSLGVFAFHKDPAFAMQGTCERHVKFTSVKNGYSLQGHVIKNLTLQLDTRNPCRVQCVVDSRCISINTGPPINDKVICELSDSDHSLHPKDLKPRPGFTYTGTENACSSNPCVHEATCLNGFTDKKYHCACPAYLTGENCEIALFQTCKELHDNCKWCKRNKAYPLKLESATVPVYCHMTDDGLDSCGGGGWTLVMKINGSKRTFHHSSNLWVNQESFNVSDGKTGFDSRETKLPTYWNTSFTKICLGMKIGQQLEFIVINKQANSLYSLIADGQYRATSLGSDTWKTLIGSQVSLHLVCTREGFNVISDTYWQSKVRIGLLGNRDSDCKDSRSRIGFGTGGYPHDGLSCGNSAMDGADNGDKLIQAMGYILVQ